MWISTQIKARSNLYWGTHADISYVYLYKTLQLNFICIYIYIYTLYYICTYNFNIAYLNIGNDISINSLALITSIYNVYSYTL